MKRLLILLCLAVVNGTSYAHQDVIIKVGAGGRLEGLPVEYSPASLRVAFLKNADPYQPTIASIELTISGSTVVVPECVASLFSTRTMKDVRVSASWYHDTSISGLPPYLSVKLYHPGNEAAPFRPGYWLLFNLSTARLLSVKVVVPGTDNSAQLVPVDLAARCSARELQEFSERRLRPNTALERSRGR